MSRIENCYFYNYDYGVVSQGSSLASGNKNCLFMGCGVGVYINSSFNSSYSNSMNDIFVDCHTGVEIVN